MKNNNEYLQLELTLLTENKQQKDILDNLPHCWSLDEAGELQHNVPVIPGMTVWHCYPNHIKLQENAPWECNVLSICESAYVTVQIKKKEFDMRDIMTPDELELYSTKKAAKVAMKIIAKKDAEKERIRAEKKKG
ncbi:MAG TPA: hypothetical protein VMX17_04375 [Candidatus Glassbacteria bacterium]|nr:hypothetical protein [Candidatus Glassbacteria bacterium]